VNYTNQKAEREKHMNKKIKIVVIGDTGLIEAAAADRMMLSGLPRVLESTSDELFPNIPKTRRPKKLPPESTFVGRCVWSQGAFRHRPGDDAGSGESGCLGFRRCPRHD
jgi:hypothetical protein